MWEFEYAGTGCKTGMTDNETVGDAYPWTWNRNVAGDHLYLCTWTRRFYDIRSPSRPRHIRLGFLACIHAHASHLCVRDGCGRILLPVWHLRSCFSYPCTETCAAQESQYMYTPGRVKLIRTCCSNSAQLEALIAKILFWN